jgi:hypothetical protein
MQKTSTVGTLGRGIYSVLFLDEVRMVPSSSIAIASNGKCLTCGGFSLGEPVHLGSFEFITDYFGGLSLFLGGATTMPFSWAQLTAGFLHHSGPQLRTPMRSSSRNQAGKDASAIVLPDDMEGEHSRHDDVSPVDGGATARNKPALRATSHSPRWTTGAIPRSASPS